MKRLIVASILYCALFLGAVAQAVPVGVLSFDVLVPPDLDGGINAFSITNLTGDPMAGGFALPPEFPVVAAVTLHDAIVTLFQGGASVVVPLGDLGPGPFPDPLHLLEFPDTDTFTAARFTATLSQTDLHLADGSIFDALPAISALLVPGAGDVLVPGSDLVLLDAAQAPLGIPEPATWLFLLVGLPLLHRGRRA